MNDLLLMEAEADIYKAIQKLFEYHQAMGNSVHLLNFASHEEEDVKYLFTFYRILVRTMEAQASAIGLFEVICKAHGHQMDKP